MSIMKFHIDVVGPKIEPMRNHYTSIKRASSNRNSKYTYFTYEHTTVNDDHHRHALHINGSKLIFYAAYAMLNDVVIECQQ